MTSRVERAPILDGSRGLEALRDRLDSLPICAERHMSCIALGRGTAKVKLLTPPALLEDGAVPAALVFGLADLAGSFALHTVLDPTDLHVTVELGLHWTAPARGGELLAEADVLRAGRRVAFAQSRIRDATGIPCCIASGTWAVSPDRPSALLRHR